MQTNLFAILLPFLFRQLKSSFENCDNVSQIGVERIRQSTKKTCNLYVTEMFIGTYKGLILYL